MKVGFYHGERFDFFSNNFDINKIETLFDTEKEIFVGLVFRYNDKIYSICSISYKYNFAEVEEIIINDIVEDKAFENNITCPYCNYVEKDSWERKYDEDEEECSQCGGIFSYERNIEITYSSTPIKAPEIKEF